MEAENTDMKFRFDVVAMKITIPEGGDTIFELKIKPMPKIEISHETTFLIKCKQLAEKLGKTGDDRDYIQELNQKLELLVSNSAKRDLGI